MKLAHSHQTPISIQTRQIDTFKILTCTTNRLYPQIQLLHLGDVPAVALYTHYIYIYIYQHQTKYTHRRFETNHTGLLEKSTDAQKEYNI